jgi:stearoyl-CoA desaturase (delta-9 desaturase)
MKYLTRATLEPYVLVCAAITLPVYSLFWIYNNFSVANVLVLYVAALFIGSPISIFMHRSWCHRSWQAKPLFNRFGILICTLLLSGNTLGWIAIHREHHRFSDTERDPHSPFYKSFWRVQFLTYLCDVKLKYVVDLARDSDHVFFAKYYWYVNLTYWILLYLINPAWLAFWFAMLGIINFCQHLVNSILHNKHKPGAKNSSILAALLLSGEPLHANHHDDPYNYNFSKHWYQFDTGAWLIWVALKLKLGATSRNRT